MTEKLRENVLYKLDPYQFAYKVNRSTEDALSTMTHLILKYLESPLAYVRVLFMDLSSAFNTLLLDIVLSKLKQMEVNPYIVKWYYAFLTRRQQQVKIYSTLSDVLVTNVGAPQDRVSFPILFTLYTNDCMNRHINNYIIKFSDDTTILSLLTRCRYVQIRNRRGCAVV